MMTVMRCRIRFLIPIVALIFVGCNDNRCPNTEVGKTVARRYAHDIRDCHKPTDVNDRAWVGQQSHVYHWCLNWLLACERDDWFKDEYWHLPLYASLERRKLTKHDRHILTLRGDLVRDYQWKYDLDFLMLGTQEVWNVDQLCFIYNEVDYVELICCDLDKINQECYERLCVQMLTARNGKQLWDVSIRNILDPFKGDDRYDLETFIKGVLSKRNMLAWTVGNFKIPVGRHKYAKSHFCKRLSEWHDIYYAVLDGCSDNKFVFSIHPVSTLIEELLSTNALCTRMTNP